MLSGLSNSIQEKLIGREVDKILDTYPEAKRDLVQHFVASGLLSSVAGPTISLGIGLFKEAMDGIGKKLGGGTKGRTSGFSVDDLGADFAGAVRMNLDTAYKKGMFTHTETKKNMVGGQGIPKEVFKKLIKKVN